MPFLRMLGLLGLLTIISGCATDNIWQPYMQQTTYSEALPERPLPSKQTRYSFSGPLPYDRQWNPPVPAREWNSIVLHHSATKTGGARRFHDYHLRVRRWENGLGYHFVIGNGSDTDDGQIEVGPRWLRQIHGAHAGVREYNQHGIGICLVGNFEKEPPSPRQMESLRQLVSFLQSRYDIPTNRVLGHRDIKPTTDCPGKHFPMAEFRRQLNRIALAGR